MLPAAGVGCLGARRRNAFPLQRGRPPAANGFVVASPRRPRRRRLRPKYRGKAAAFAAMRAVPRAATVDQRGSMPRRHKRECASPRCANLTRRTYCDECQATPRARDYDLYRPSAAKRGYGRKWRDVTRRRILRRDPFCRAPSCRKPSTDVDHVVPCRISQRQWCRRRVDWFSAGFGADQICGTRSQFRAPEFDLSR